MQHLDAMTVLALKKERDLPELPKPLLEEMRRQMMRPTEEANPEADELAPSLRRTMLCLYEALQVERVQTAH